jgi:hypothetical protein
LPRSSFPHSIRFSSERSSLLVLWPCQETDNLKTKRSHEGELCPGEVGQVWERVEGERECWTAEHRHPSPRLSEIEKRSNHTLQKSEHANGRNEQPG